MSSIAELTVNRYLHWYDLKSEESVGEEQLKGITLQQLQELFDVPTDDPMYDCWEVKKKHVVVLQKHVDVNIALDKYWYFIEASI